MSFHQFREIRLRDFRCFREEQTARLAPLTLLVGENSTGKTSFLAAVQAVWDAAHGSGDPDFRKAPFDLGSFLEIVHSRGGRASVADSFAIGFRELVPGRRRVDEERLQDEDRSLDFDVTFESRGAAPAPATIAWRDGAVSVKYLGSDDKGSSVVFESSSGSWRCPVPVLYPQASWPTGRVFRLLLLNPANDPFEQFKDDLWEPLREGSKKGPGKNDLEAFESLWSLYLQTSAWAPLFAGAPNHPGPRRTYDPAKVDMDPWGADIPSYLANLQLRDRAAWTALKEKLDEFGRESGLFDDFSVKQLTGVEGGPFQLQVRKFGKRGRKGPKRNLMDVGFGVSQVLPALAALFRADGPPMFLLQQPELHLHPSAQAALGSLFCRTVAEGRQIIVETHSEYIVDRIRMDLRDRQATLTPDDVSILFFDRSSDHDVCIHSLRFDEQGNLQGAPDGYGQFFMDEVRRSVGL